MDQETILRLSAFFGIFMVMALWEIAAPMRRRVMHRSGRWITNWSISIINSTTTAVMKVGLGAAAVIAALDASEKNVGLFNALAWPTWLEIFLIILLLDLAIWIQHLASHKIPLLWRLHRVHHADRDFDVTTAIRFHPLEIGLSMLFKIGLVYALGAPVVAVVLFEILLSGSAMFNHANVRLPAKLDSVLRAIIVTPDMHRVHHSIDRQEHDANYGFNLSVWDRIFRTYVPQPRLGHEGMTIGLAPYQTGAPARLGWSLINPFRN